MNTLLSILKSKAFYIGILRYGLAMIMMGYGMFKMWGYQGAYISPASAWQLPFEALNGNQLVWAIVGYSRWMQFLIGAMEFFPACLLLFRRTQLLGAFLLLPATLTVFVLNFGLDLWSFTKMSSSLLLAANTIIILSHWQKVRSICSLLLTNITNRKFGWIEVVVNIAIILYFSRKLLYPLYHKEANTKPFCGDCFNRHPNEWILTQETINDSTLPPSNLRCYFTPRGVYSEISDHNLTTEYLMYEVDTGKSQLSMRMWYAGQEDIFLLPQLTEENFQNTFTYTFSGDTLLRLTNTNNHSWLFHRRVINEGRL